MSSKATALHTQLSTLYLPFTRNAIRHAWRCVLGLSAQGKRRPETHLKGFNPPKNYRRSRRWVLWLMHLPKMANWRKLIPHLDETQINPPKASIILFHLHHELCPCLLSVPLYHWIHFKQRDTRIRFHRHLIDLIWIAPAVGKASKFPFRANSKHKKRPLPVSI